MAKKWTDEETTMMIGLADSYSPEEVAKRMAEQGYKRSATAIPLKYAHITGESWPEKKTRVVKYDSSDGPDLIVIAALVIGAIIIGYWWTTQ